METDVIYNAVISLVISSVVFAIVKYLMSHKLANLKGTNKLLGLISTIII